MSVGAVVRITEKSIKIKGLKDVKKRNTWIRSAKAWYQVVVLSSEFLKEIEDARREYNRQIWKRD